MIIFVVNSGSSSLKYQLLDMETETVLAKGLIEKIGVKDESIVQVKTRTTNEKTIRNVLSHKQAIALVLEQLLSLKETGLQSLDQINAVGHRVVQGGDTFSKAVVIDSFVYEKIKEYKEMAPLHNKAHLDGIDACVAAMPHIPQIAVFDTAYHQTMEPAAYMYGLPYELATRLKIRRYGAHGTSHKYVAQKTAELLQKELNELKLITCHLGNGASIAAVEYGKVVDTSMGFTPQEGLLMGTRCGDMDTTVVLYMMEKQGLKIKDMDKILNKESGLKGISGISNDLREIYQAIEAGNERACLARDMFVRRVKKYIGSYAALMNGVDAIVFTAGIGENDAVMRRLICADMGYLGIDIDEEKNASSRGTIMDLTSPKATVRTLVVPTEEELEIAREVVELITAGE